MKKFRITGFDREAKTFTIFIVWAYTIAGAAKQFVIENEGYSVAQVEPV